MGPDVVRCTVLGQAEISAQGFRLTPEVELQYALALYFCVNAGREVPRDEVARLFWPEVGLEAARHCLRQALYRLRSMGLPVRSGAKSISLDGQAVEADHTPVVAEGASPGAFLRLADVAVLPGYVPQFSPPYARWVEEFRGDVAARMRRGLVRAIADVRSRGRYAEVERLARHCLVLDPLNEEATLALAEAIALSGGKAEAVGMIERYLTEMGGNKDLRVSATILRARVSEFARPSGSDGLPSEPILGRDEDLERLFENLQASRVAGAHHVCLTGEAGVGKTTLVEEFLRVSRLQGVATGTVTCHRSDSRRPLGALIDLLPILRRLPGAVGASPESLTVLTLLSTYTFAPDPALTAHTPHFLTEEQVEGATSDLVDAILHETPLALHIDDAHWIDAESGRILRSLLSSPRRALLLVSCVTGNPAEVQRGSWPLYSTRTSVRRVEPLSYDNARRLATTLAAHHELTLIEKQLEELVQISGGSPLYIAELVRGQISSPSAEGGSTLRSLVQSRIDGLDQISKTALQAVTVLGKYASVARLEAVLELPAYRLIRALRDLETQGLVGLSAHVVRCRHEYIADICGDGTPPAVAALLHRRASGILETDAQKLSDPALLWQSARHADFANLSADARRLLRHLATYFLGVGSAPEAARALESALDTCSSDEDSLALLSELSEVYRTAGDWQSLRRTLERRTALLRRSRARAVNGERELFLRYEAEFHIADDMASILPALLGELKTTSGSPEHRAALALMAIVIADNVFDRDAAISAFSSIDASATSSVNAPFHATLARLVYHTIFGDLDEAGTLALSLADAIRARASLRIEDLQQLRWATIPLSYLGLFERAEEILLDVIRRARRELIWPEAYEAASLLTHLSLRISDVDAAARWFDEATRWSERTSEELVRSSMCGLGALLRLAQDRPSDARKLVIDAEPYVRARSEGRTRARFLSLKAAVALRLEGAISRDLETELNMLVTRSLDLGDADLGVSALAYAFHLRGQTEDRDVLLQNLWQHRRERHPVPEFLRRQLLPVLG